jgi:hypothetical protein
MRDQLKSLSDASGEKLTWLGGGSAESGWERRVAACNGEKEGQRYTADRG